MQKNTPFEQHAQNIQTTRIIHRKANRIKKQVQAHKAKQKAHRNQKIKIALTNTIAIALTITLLITIATLHG